MSETEKKSDSGKTGNKSVKKDIIIVAAVIVIGAALILLLFLLKKPGKTIVVSVDGKTVATYSISEEIDTVIRGVGGWNRLVISQGKVSVSDADCPDKLCVNQGQISESPDSIVCLPHKLIVRVESEDRELDAVSGEQK